MSKKENEEGVIYTIPLKRVFIASVKSRSPRAIRLLRSFLQKHLKVEDIIITNEVNEKIWGRGIEKPPRRIRVKAVKSKEGTATVYLAEGE
jgi:large subunit ribosomal protein L31e